MKLPTRKQKGDLAELKVACDLRRRGYLVLIPFGEEAPYDIVIDRDGVSSASRSSTPTVREAPQLRCGAIRKP